MVQCEERQLNVVRCFMQSYTFSTIFSLLALRGIQMETNIGET